jgi:rhamnose utilization protein RhaD (predicted bifunctional aldolase and dehydrogenase)
METRIPGATENLWDARKAEGLSELEALAHRSNLLGRDRAVANYGGGNTSTKTRERDHTGREVDVLWVKGSGSDLATIEAVQFTGLKLDEVLALEEREEMSDEEMVAYLASCQLAPDMPRGSKETLLHAFVPYAQVDHTHPDAVNMICCSEGGEELARECFGDDVVWIPYIRPGFILSKQVGEAVRNNPEAKFVLLAKHGLVTWGDTHEESYCRTIEAVNRAAEFVASGAGEPFGGRKIEPPAPDRREELFAEVLPALRGALSSGSDESSHKILRVDHTSEDVLAFVCGRDSEELSQIGAACPDHLVRTKVRPLWVNFDPENEDADELVEKIRRGVTCYREEYEAYFSRYEEADEEMFDPNPRVVLIGGLGLVAAAKNAKEANLSRDFVYRAINVMRGAHALGGYVSLTEEESYAVEYWPLELYKLTFAPPPDELAGRVAFVTGGRHRERRSQIAGLTRGLCGGLRPRRRGGGRDRREPRRAWHPGKGRRDGRGRGGPRLPARYSRVRRRRRRRIERRPRLQRPHRGHERRDVGQELRRTDEGILPRRSGGLPHHERAGRWRQPRLRRLQELHGGGQERIGVFLGEGGRVAPGAVPGRGGGAERIRVNTVNPDAVLQGSRIWGSDWRQERAAAYGIEPEELEDYYRQRNVLKVNVLPENVAEAVLHFASEVRSSRSTGNILNVDGGVKDAYPR